MGYCRFENTLGDIQDCQHSVLRQDKLSEWEMNAAKQMIQACQSFIEDATRLGFKDEENNIHFIKS